MSTALVLLATSCLPALLLQEIAPTVPPAERAPGRTPGAPSTHPPTPADQAHPLGVKSAPVHVPRNEAAGHFGGVLLLVALLGLGGLGVLNWLLGHLP